MKPTVLVIQEVVPHYRVPFFRFLADELGSRDLDLRVVSSSVLPKVDELGFPHQRVPTSRWGLSALGTIYRERPAVLVLPHSARFAPVATTTRFLQSRGRKQLFWGSGLARRYGAASEHDRRPAAEPVRRLMLSICDHYLSYTEISTTNILNRGDDSTTRSASDPLRCVAGRRKRATCGSSNCRSASVASSRRIPSYCW